VQYFFSRASVFIVLICIGYVLLPNLLLGRTNPIWWAFPLVFMALVTAGGFFFLFALCELFRRTLMRKFSIESKMRKDALLMIGFLIASLFWLFLPRPSGFSFGDSEGEIIKNGALTLHGYYFQSKLFLANMAIAALFWIIFRFVFRDKSQSDQSISLRE
jgi:uncharacterized membrane-anchored protein